MIRRGGEREQQRVAQSSWSAPILRAQRPEGRKLTLVGATINRRPKGRKLTLAWNKKSLVDMGSQTDLTSAAPRHVAA